ncbi:MAG: acyl-CoA dehydrogenase family protein [Alphaproteobacteria bacterium]|nr:acyl-CoA dehydrogenase family protein [Alphaproteobacteria bacterium]
MDFLLSEEQILLQDSVVRFVQDEYEFEKRRKIISSEDGFSRDNWKTFAELGWLAMPFPEEMGGIDGTPVETMVLMESIGKGLIVEPYLATVVLAGGLIKEAGSPAQQEELIGGIVDGSTMMAFAYAEAQGRYNLADLVTTASQQGDGWVLKGSKCVVLGGPSADKLVVSARTSGDQMDSNGISLFIVDANASGVSRRNYTTVDGNQASDITFNNVSLANSDLLGAEGNALPIIEKIIDEATAAVCAEAVGAMEVTYQASVEYAKTREQFGVAIGQFQVLQHCMVEMFMETEQTKSLLYLAIMKLAEGADDAAKTVSALKAKVGTAGRFVGQQAIQIHGGMGMTDEMSVGHYFKRLTMINTLFGSVDHHMKRFAQLSD